MVLYRKYRPQKIEELDLETIKNRLVRILSSPFLPHAFLLAGPKGTGKTSSARIIAKVLNCEKRAKDRIEPCNVCEACISITSGRHMDILEIDAASNRGIDEIRELREKIKFAPVSAKYKIYIIDEAHMLTNEAFNALLKTLEEPPKHAIFILATTEAEKLPETILSRCIRLDFHKALDAEILHSLKRVVSGEKISVSDEVLLLIAKFSDGSFRDATKFLEQAVSENCLDENSILKFFGRDNLKVEFFLELLKEKKTKEALKTILSMTGRGVDFRFFISEVLNFLHNLLLAQHGIDKEKVHGDYLDLFTKKEIYSLVQVFSKVYIDLKYAGKPELLLEVAVVEWCEK